MNAEDFDGAPLMDGEEVLSVTPIQHPDTPGAWVFQIVARHPTTGFRLVFMNLRAGVCSEEEQDAFEFGQELSEQLTDFVAKAAVIQLQRRQ